jgi:CARDB
MKSQNKTFRILVVTFTTFAIVAPQAAWAHGGGGGGHASHSASGSSGNSYAKPRPTSSSASVIPAANGNTGINGTGLPSPTNSGSRATTPNQPIPAANGNTGISGIGLPKTAGTAKGCDKCDKDGHDDGKGSQVIPAPNGNTGFSGIGVPQCFDSAKCGKKDNHDGGKNLSGNTSQVTPAANGNTGINGTGLPKPQSATSVAPAANGNTGINGGPSPTPDVRTPGSKVVDTIGFDNLSKSVTSPASIGAVPKTDQAGMIIIGGKTALPAGISQEAGSVSRLTSNPLPSQAIAGRLVNKATQIKPGAANAKAPGVVTSASVQTTYTRDFLGLGAAANGLGQALSSGVNAVGNAISDGASAIGSGVSSAASGAVGVVKNVVGLAQGAVGIGTALGAAGVVGVVFNDLVAAAQGRNFTADVAGDGNDVPTRNRPGGYYQPKSNSSGNKVPLPKIILSTTQSPTIPTPPNRATTSSVSKLVVRTNASKIASLPTSTLPAGPMSNPSMNPKAVSPTASKPTSRLGSSRQSLSGSAGGGGDSEPVSPADDTPAADTTPMATAPPEGAPIAAATPTTPVTAAANVDLVLEDVQLTAPATLVAGPAYTVKFRNQGTAAAGKFLVGVLVGLDGQLTADAPRAIVEVPALAADEVKQVTLRLPLGAMKMAGKSGDQATAFTHLFIGIDLTNAVAETDKTNNTAVVERAALETGSAK